MSFWVSNLTDDEYLAIKATVEADLETSNVEQASSVDESVTIEDSVINALAK
jgi:hypothetical protein